QLSVDGLDVADGIDCAGDVMDVGVIETADDLDDGVDFADVAEKLVAETFTLGGTLDQPGDIDELDGGGNDDGSFGKFCERLEARIGNGYNAEVRIDGAERIVGGLGFARVRDRVE